MYPQKIIFSFFYIDNNKKCFLSIKSALEFEFMKYHMNLKTGVMTAENAAMPSQKKNTF